MANDDDISARTVEVLHFLRRIQLLGGGGERFLSQEQAAELLDVSVDFIEKLVALDELERFDINYDSSRSMWRIRYTDLIAFIERVADRNNEDPDTVASGSSRPPGQKKHQPTRKEFQITS